MQLIKYTHTPEPGVDPKCPPFFAGGLYKKPAYCPFCQSAYISSDGVYEFPEPRELTPEENMQKVYRTLKNEGEND